MNVELWSRGSGDSEALVKMELWWQSSGYDEAQVTMELWSRCSRGSGGDSMILVVKPQVLARKTVVGRAVHSFQRRLWSDGGSGKIMVRRRMRRAKKGCADGGRWGERRTA